MAILIGVDDGEYGGYESGYFNGQKEMQKKAFADGRKPELERHFATARKLLALGMSREKIQELTGFSKKEMAML